MNGEKLYEAIGMIDDKYLARLDPYEKKSSRIMPVHFAAFVAAAACFCVIAAGALILPKLTGALITSPAPVSTSDTDEADTSASETSTTETSAPDTSDSVMVETDDKDDDLGKEETAPAPDNDQSFKVGCGPLAKSLYYTPPVFPMTLLEEDSDISAERNIIYDFLSWKNADNSLPNVTVYDKYLLKNSSSEDKTVTVLYPFASRGTLYKKDEPKLLVGGERLDTELHVGGYTGTCNIRRGIQNRKVDFAEYEGWERFDELLSDGSYKDDALNFDPGFKGISVIVYKFSDCWSDPQNGETNPTARISYKADDSITQVRGFISSSVCGQQEHKDGEITTHTLLMSIGRPDDILYGGTSYLVVFGRDIADITVDYYNTGGFDTEQKMPEGTAGMTITRYIADLDTVMREMAEFCRENYAGDPLQLEPEEYYKVFSEYYVNGDKLIIDDDYDVIAGWDNCERVMYVSAEVTIPAGESIEITAKAHKTVSYGGENPLVPNDITGGYDALTRLGSNLQMNSQTAAIEDHVSIEIVRQNFGFDLENGINEVELDPNIERYYLEVRNVNGE